ncbi:hypothetical protein HPS35_08550 [Enterococcus faecium]|nr:hypothetical protein [Enterococcus faecium]
MKESVKVRNGDKNIPHNNLEFHLKGAFPYIFQANLDTPDWKNATAGAGFPVVVHPLVQ